MLKKMIRNKDLWSVAFFMLLTGCFFSKGFLQNQIIWGFDTPKIIFPLINLLEESLKSLKLPLWTPDIYFGFPIGADGQIPWYFPFSLLHIFLPLPLTLFLLSFLHVFFAGIFTYIFARIINLNRTAAVFAGAAFMFNGFIISHLQYFSHIYGYAYLPLELLFIELAIRRSNNIYFAIAGVALGFQFLSGHPNIPIMSLLYVTCYSLMRLEFNKLKFIKALLIIGLIAILIALPYLNVLSELVPLSVRAAGVVGALYSSFSFFDFITFVFPNFFFTNTGSWTVTPTWHFWTYWGQVETTGYIGLVTLLLIPFAFIRPNLKKSGVFLTLLLISFLLALGKNTPIYTVLLNLPFLKSMTAPGKFLFLSDFSLALLAAIGLNYISENNIKNKIRWITAVILIPISLFLLVTFSQTLIKVYPDGIYKFFLDKYSPLGYVQGIENRDSFLSEVSSSLTNQTSDSLKLITGASLLILLLIIGYKNKYAKFSIILLLVIDLWLFANHVNGWLSPDKLFNETNNNIIFLKQNLAHSFDRVYTFSKMWSDLMPDQLMLHRIQDGNGFVSLPLQRFAEWQVLAEENWQKGNPELFRLGSIGYVYDPAAASPVPVSSTLPRAYVTSGIIEASGQGALERLNSDSFDPRFVIIEDAFGNYSQNIDNVKFTQAEISVYHDNYVKILSDTYFDGALVLTDSFYPGWKAFVDGKETKIYQANYLFRAIFLSKEHHVIEFEYKPRFLRTTIMISAGTFLLILFLVSKEFLLKFKK